MHYENAARDAARSGGSLSRPVIKVANGYHDAVGRNATTTAGSVRGAQVAELSRPGNRA